MLVECVRGVEEPELEPELTDEGTLESVSGESGADSSPAPGEEKSESLTLGGFNNLPPSACVRVRSGLATYRQTPLSRTSFVVSFRREYATPPYTCSYTRTHADPDEAHHADTRSTQETQENATAAASTGTQGDGRVDALTRSRDRGCVPCWGGG